LALPCCALFVFINSFLLCTLISWHALLLIIDTSTLCGLVAHWCFLAMRSWCLLVFICCVECSCCLWVPPCVVCSCCSLVPPWCTMYYMSLLLVVVFLLCCLLLLLIGAFLLCFVGVFWLLIMCSYCSSTPLYYAFLLCVLSVRWCFLA